MLTLKVPALTLQVTLIIPTCSFKTNFHLQSIDIYVLGLQKNSKNVRVNCVNFIEITKCFFIIFLEKEPFPTKNILKWAINGQLKDDKCVLVL